MKRLSPRAAAALVIAAVLIASPASAYVQPQGKILPTYDIRFEGIMLAGSDVGASDMDTPLGMGPGEKVEYEPTAVQTQTVDRLRSSIPGLSVSYEPMNGMPRMLHAWGKPLTNESDNDPVAIARTFLRTNRDLFRLSIREIASLTVIRDAATYSTPGPDGERDEIYRTIWLAQQVDGILVNHGAIRFAIDPKGRLVWASSGYLVPGLELDTTAHISPEEAVLAAARHIDFELEEVPNRLTPMSGNTIEFEPGPFLSPVVTKLLIFPMSKQTGLLSYEILLEPKNDISVWYAVTVDARSGRLLHRTNLYKYVTNGGLVFGGQYPDVAVNHNPAFVKGSPQGIFNFGYRWQSTAGWTIPAPWGDYTLTIGNNTETREDKLGDNETTLGLQADGGPLQEWFFPFTDAYANSTGADDQARIADGAVDLNAVITNLFYWTNQWHDRMYELGFDEQWGNFQFDNFARGGCGTDAIRTDAQDNALGGSRNNANFGTPAEPLDCVGSFRPRMQQYVTRFGAAATPSWLGDTSLDADVIIHEFSHGTSHRLVGGAFVGGLGKHQSGAMGEGWGDWYAGSNFSDPVMGEYSFADPVAGVRNFPMDGNPRTYADVCDTVCQVHYNGEVWASTLWDMRALVGKDIADQLVTDGMKFSVVDPIMPDMRNGILIADQLRYGGAYHCQIWEAFFNREMGFDADSPDGAFPIPDNVFTGPTCSGWAHVRVDSAITSDADGDGLFRVGELIDAAIVLQNFDGASTATAVSATITSPTANVTIVTGSQAYPDIAVGGTQAPSVNFQFQTEPGFVCGGQIVIDVAINWGGTLTRNESFIVAGGSTDGTALFFDDAEGTPLPVGGSAEVVTTQNHTPGGTNSYHMLKGCYAGDILDCAANNCAGTCSTVSLPKMKLPNDQSVVFSFWSTYNNESGFDGLFVRISTDDGASWSYVDTMNYTGTIGGGGCAGGGPDGIAGPPGNGGLSPWTNFRGNLAAWADQEVIIEVVQKMDGCVEFEGSYVDDLEIIVQACQTAGFVDTFMASKNNQDDVNASCTDPDSLPDPGETIDVTIALTNSGNQSAANLTATLSTTNPSITITSPVVVIGPLSPGQTGFATFRYDVALTGVPCFGVADFTVDVTATGYVDAFTFSEELRSDQPSGFWFDDFEGSQPAWIPSLGPDGADMDWAIRSKDCANHGNFWSVNVSMVDPTVCGSGEPDFSPDSDSVLTSPMIDLGAPSARLGQLIWRAAPSAYGGSWGGTVLPGFVEVSIDFDGSGWTQLAMWPNGQNSIGGLQSIDIQNNPAGSPIPASVTIQNVRVQFRFRATGPDTSGGRNSDGMIIDDFVLTWDPCDVNACTPGIRNLTSSGGSSETMTTGSTNRPSIGLP